uniref:Uncharacterized protein n=1 Tax=Rhizophora mucronata TaxID=61149 RepID=A0A2P2PY69_RHIMU
MVQWSRIFQLDSSEDTRKYST